MTPVEPAAPSLGDAIRELRYERDLTQEDVALDAGITPGSLSRIECGRSNPTWSTVERIADALQISLVQLAEAVEAQRR